MNPWPVEAEVPEVHLPRPGHADLVGDAEVRLLRRAQRARARERPRDRGARGGRRRWPRRSCARSASRCSPTYPDRRRCAHRERDRLALGDFADVDESPVRCLDADASRAMVEQINVLRKRTSRSAACSRCARSGSCPGSAPTCPGRSASTGARRALLSIQAIKGVGLGDGFDLAGRPGSQAHDEIFCSQERGYYRETNRAGGLEGGMTTGEPARRARRDEAAADADQAAALGRHRDARARPGAARAHRLVHRSRRRAWWGRRWSRSCWRTPTARSSAATTSTTCAPPSTRTASASGGGGGVSPPRARLHRLHGRGQVDRRPRGGGRARRARARHRPRVERGSARRSRASSPSTARRRSARARSDVVCELLEAPPAPVVSLGGGAVASPRVREALPATPSCCSTSTSTTAWGRAGRQRAAARPRPRALRRAARRARRRCTRRWPTRCSSTAAPDRPAALRGALRGGPAGARCCGPERHGQYPVSSATCSHGASGRWRGRRFAHQPTRPWRRCTPSAAGLPRRAAHAAGRGRQDAGHRRAGAGALARDGMTRADHVVALGGGVVGDLGGFCAAATSAASRSCRCRRRSSRRSTRPTAARPASTCPRARTTSGAYHQPRGRPRRPATLGTLPAEELAAGWAEVVKTALIAGGQLWERVRARRSSTTATSCWPAPASSWPSSRRTSATPAGARCSTSATRSGTRSRPPRATRATATARRWGSGCSPRCGCRAGRAARRGRRAAGRRGLPTRSRSAVARGRVAAVARQEARGGGRRRSSSSRAPGDVRTGAPVEPGDAARRRGRVGGVMRNRIEVMHGVNLDMLGRRDPEHYGTLTLPELERRVETGARARARGALLPDQPRGRVRRAPAQGRRTYADGIVLNPGAWTHYAWAIRDALEIAGLPAVEVHLSDVDAREQWRRISVLDDLCVETVSGRGRGRIPRRAGAAEGGARRERRGRPAGRARRRARARRAARHGPRQPALPDGLHRHERARARRAATCARSSPTSATSSRRAEEVAGFDREQGAAASSLGALADGGGRPGAARLRRGARVRARARGGWARSLPERRRAGRRRRHRRGAARGQGAGRGRARSARPPRWPTRRLRWCSRRARGPHRARGRARARARDAPARGERPELPVDRRRRPARRAAARRAARRRDPAPARSS